MCSGDNQRSLSRSGAFAFPPRHPYDPLFHFDDNAWDEFEKRSQVKCNYLQDSTVVTRNYAYGRKNESSIRSSFRSWLNCVKRENQYVTYTFEKVYRRMLPTKFSAEARQKADPREFRVYNDEIYMVREYYTSGFQTVEDGHFHLIITANKSLDLYVTPVRQTSSNGYFAENLQSSFSRDIIKTGTYQKLDPGQQYILIAPQFSIFYFKKFSSLAAVNEVLNANYREGVLASGGVPRPNASGALRFHDNEPPSVPGGSEPSTSGPSEPLKTFFGYSRRYF